MSLAFGLCCLNCFKSEMTIVLFFFSVVYGGVFVITFHLLSYLSSMLQLEIEISRQRHDGDLREKNRLSRMLDNKVSV